MTPEEATRVARICVRTEAAVDILDALDPIDVKIAIRVISFMMEEFERGRPADHEFARIVQKFILEEIRGYA